MYITPISTQYSFRGLLNRKKAQNPQEPEFVIRGQGERILKYEIKDDVMFVKGKPYTGKVRLDYRDGRKEHRHYEDGRVASSDLNGNGTPKVFYAYEPLPNGQVKQYAFYEDENGIKGTNEK